MDTPLRPSVTVKLTLAKYDGDIEPGKQPVEVIESEETMPLEEFLARQQAANGGE